MSDFDRIDRPSLPPKLTVVADALWEQAHGAPPLQDDPVAARLGLTPASVLDSEGGVRSCAAVGELVRDFIYQLDRGEYGVLRNRMVEVADWLADLPLPVEGGE